MAKIPAMERCPRGAVMTHLSWDDGVACVLGMLRLPRAWFGTRRAPEQGDTDAPFSRHPPDPGRPDRRDPPDRCDAGAIPGACGFPDGDARPGRFAQPGPCPKPGPD